MDGARLANAVAALGCNPAELTWRAGVDMLSFGAIKNGSITADAIVVFDRSVTTELSFRAKRAGQLAAKMRFAAAQLDAYLADDLWLRNAWHANAMTARLEEGLKSIPGTRLAGTPEANILFCRLPQQVIDGLLDQGYDFYHGRWEPGVVRFVTSFATTTHDVDELVHAVRRLTAARSRKAGLNGFERRDQPAAADLVEGDPHTGSGIGRRIIADRDGLVDEHQYLRVVSAR
jgi:threonine aldolase